MVNNLGEVLQFIYENTSYPATVKVGGIVNGQVKQDRIIVCEASHSLVKRLYDLENILIHLTTEGLVITMLTGGNK